MSSPLQRFRNRLQFRWSLAGGLALAGAVVSLPVMADDVSALAARLSTLRGEVETLASRLGGQSADQKEQLRSLSRQRSELELEAKREETRVQKLAAAVAKRRAEVETERAKGDRLVPLFEESLVAVRGYVEKALPFRREERLASLDKLQEQYKSGLLTPARALQRVWSFVEDEFRMTKESGLYKQTIEVDGQERLAEVIRVGMVMLFYKTDDGRVGYVALRDGTYVYERFGEPDQQKLVLELFTSFKKQVRVGYFQLPNGLASAVVDAPALPALPSIPLPETANGAVRAGEPATNPSAAPSGEVTP